MWCGPRGKSGAGARWDDGAGALVAVAGGHGRCLGGRWEAGAGQDKVARSNVAGSVVETVHRRGRREHGQTESLHGRHFLEV